MVCIVIVCINYRYGHIFSTCPLHNTSTLAFPFFLKPLSSKRILDEFIRFIKSNVIELQKLLGFSFLPCTHLECWNTSEIPILKCGCLEIVVLSFVSQSTDIYFV